MKSALATAGLQAHAAAPRLVEGCGVAAYPWHDTNIRPVNPAAMHVFETSKATRRRKEPSP